MQTKVFSICLDMRQSLPFHPFEVTEGDTGNVLHVTLQNEGEPLLLNDCKVVVVLASSMGFAMQDETSGVTIGEAAGTFTVLLDPNNYGSGNVSVDVQVYSGPDKTVLVTSTRFDFRCRRALVSEEIIRANAAYPPLLAAAREAREAAAAALAAAAFPGEINVQSDWSEADGTSDAFIRNKPLLTPFALGAAERLHAGQHAAGGIDVLTPADIGAARASAQTVTLTAGGWSGEDRPYSQAVAVSGMTAACSAVVCPVYGSTAEYGRCGVLGYTQSDGALTFTCNEKPETDLCVNVLTVFADGGQSSGALAGESDQELSNSELLTIWNH